MNNSSMEELLTNLMKLRIQKIEQLLQSAKECLDEKDYFQSAVRLEEMKIFITFDSEALRILEVASE